MSCLYSSPEVISLEVTNSEITNLRLSLSSLPDPVRRVAHAPIRNAVQFHTEVACRVQQRRVPQQPVDIAGCTESFSLPKQAQVSRVSFQAQYQAFVRFAVGSSAALSAIALK
jgi:hypothetical protein